MNNLETSYTPYDYISNASICGCINGPTSICDIVSVNGIFSLLLSNREVCFLNMRLRHIPKISRIPRVDLISASEKVLLCIEAGKMMTLYQVSMDRVLEIGKYPIQKKYDQCHVTANGDFIILSSNNILECYGVQYREDMGILEAQVFPLAQDEDSISSDQYVTYITSCYDEDTKKTTFLISDSDCQLSTIEINIDTIEKRYCLELVATDILISSADYISAATIQNNVREKCDIPDKDQHQQQGKDILLNDTRSMIVSSTEVSYIDSKNQRTHKSTDLNSDYFVGVEYLGHPSWQEFAAIKTQVDCGRYGGEVEGIGGEEGIKKDTCPSERVLFFRECGDRLIQTRSLSMQQPQSERGRISPLDMRYRRGREHVSPALKMEMMDGGHLARGIQRIFVVDEVDGETIIMKREEGIISWRRRGRGRGRE